MTNYKVSNKGDFTTVTYRQRDPLQVNQREMGLLDRNMIPGFMKPRWDTANEMAYLAPSSIPLKKYLAKDCTIEKVCQVLHGIINAIQQVGANQLVMQNLLLNSQYIFVRPMSNDMYFVYEPYLKNTTQADVLALFMSVISMAKIKDKNQKIQLEQLKGFVSSHSRLDELDNYLKTMQTTQSAMSGYGTQMNVPNPTSGSMTTPSMYDVMEDEGTTVLGYEDEGTTVLNAADHFEPETTVLRRDPIVTLVRSKDGSAVQLTGMECTLGRSADNFVVVRDNTDVSRYHAVITMNQGAYSVMDRGSKNGTTLNGRNLMANVTETIQNGDVLVFGGEEFTFVVEE